MGVPVQCENLLAWGKEERKFTPPGTKHGASMWSQDWKPYGILACGDVQRLRDHVGDKERSAKGLSRAVQLNPLASRETSGAIDAKHVLPCFLTLIRLEKIA